MNLFYCDAMQKHYMSNINSIKFSLILVEKLIKIYNLNKTK